MDFSFCRELDTLLRSRRTVGRSGRVFDGLGALSTAHNLEVLRSLMLEREPQQTLEVGLSFGGSALTIAASHRDLGRPAAAQHTALDPYQHSVWDGAAEVLLQSAGLAGYVDVRRQYSAVALAQLLDQQRTFDLIYVDGSHLFEDVFVDAYFGFRLLSNTGLILFDDCTTEHVAKVLSFVATNWPAWVDEIDLSKYRADGRSWRYQAGRRLGKVQLRAFRRIASETRAWDSPLRKF